MAFDQSTRNRLQRFVNDTRTLLTEEFTRQLQATYGLDPKTGTVADIDSLTHLDNRQRQTAQILRDTMAHYLATTHGKGEADRSKQALSRVVREQAFTVLNRLAALRMAEARGFLLESITKGYDSKGFQLYKQLVSSAHGETGETYRNYLYSVFDELSLDLAVLFDRHNTQGRLFPRESSLIELLEQINHYEVVPLWTEDETIGWIYQFWNGRDEIDRMRAASRAPRNSREMAVRNQFFTPRYVVEFLTDNTLGRVWYEMTQGNTQLVESCRYLVRRPTEIFLKQGEKISVHNELREHVSQSRDELQKQSVYIPFRAIKDPRCIRILDPACGSMHFGLYAFDLFEHIYQEAWQLENELGAEAFVREDDILPLHQSFVSFEEFKAQIPRLIIEHNIHGVDIDQRAVQIAGLSLWQRAHRTWQLQDLKSHQRPAIKKSNIVCAEPMPGQKALLQEFTSILNPPILGQLVEVIFDKMQFVGEAGMLLKIEEEIQTSIYEAREQWLSASRKKLTGDMFENELDAVVPQKKLSLMLSQIDDESFWDNAEQLILDALRNYADKAEYNTDQKRLFAEDSAKGFAFINLCKKRFDILLMNPPFGEASLNSKKYIDDRYFHTKGDVLANFVERAINLTEDTGLVGAITSRTCLFLSTMSRLRESVLGVDAEIQFCADLGDGVLDAMVETAAYTISKTSLEAVFFRLVVEKDKEENLRLCCSNQSSNDKVFIVFPSDFRKIYGAPYIYWIDYRIIEKIALSTIEPEVCEIKVGLQTGDDFRYLRNYWEVPSYSIGDEWRFYTKTEKAIAWHSPINLVVNWKTEGHEIKNFVDGRGKLRSRPQNLGTYFKPGFSYMLRSSRLVPYVIPKGCIPTAGRSQIFPHKGKEIDVLAICASNLGSAIARFHGGKFGWPTFQAGMVQQLPYVDIPEEIKNSTNETIQLAISDAKKYYSTDETTLDFLGCYRLNIKDEPKTNFSTLLGEENELKLAACYGLDDHEYQNLRLDLQQAVSLRKDQAEISVKVKQEEQSATRYLSWLIGVAFGRWHIKVKTSSTSSEIFESLPSQPIAFKLDAQNSYIEKNGIADINSPNSLITLLENIQDETSVANAFSVLGIKDWQSYLERSSGFFSSHFKQYTQNRRYSPIYWSLQTSSGSYTLWVYYHRLNDQTLYICINDLVEPKLRIIAEDIHTLRGKSKRSSQEEKDLTQLTDLERELRDLRDELLHIAKFWKPNLNDGVQITAAPLWKLIQHNAWKKKLKETWERLERGDYDWAHLACSIWPERVFRKCHQDHSLAIAHDVEETFWHEVEIQVKRGKEIIGETRLEWQPKVLSDAELDALIQEKVKEMNA